LRVEATPGTVTPELRALIANRKGDLLAELDHTKHDGREARQTKVEAKLRTHPEMRVAFDMTDIPLEGWSGEPVSVVLAVRHGDTILSGELHIPAERWDMRAFLAVVDCGSEEAQ
jgi:hypothetical protein